MEAMELMGELETCGFAMEPGMWLCAIFCLYGCTSLGCLVFSPVLSLVGGALMEVFSKRICGGVSGALELGTALGSCSFELVLELQLVLGMCKHDVMDLAVLASHLLCLCCMVLGWWCWLEGLCVSGNGVVVKGLVLRRICGIYCGGFSGVMLWVVVCMGYVEFVSLVRCGAV